MEATIRVSSGSRWQALWSELTPLERWAYPVLFTAAAFTRLWRLGERVMSHDESLHVYYAWQLFQGQGFQHTPLMHGPLKFHLDALAYWLFGASDFTGRLPVALAGIVLVMMPLFMRRWLGRWGSLMASFLFLVSPMVMYHSRYIRDEGLMALWAVLAVWMIFAYLETREDRWLYGLAASVALFYTTMEAAFIYLAIFGLLLFLAWCAAVLFDPRCSWEDRLWLGAGTGLLVLGGGATLVGLESGSQGIPGAFVCKPEAIPRHGLWLTLGGGLVALAGVGILGWVLAGRWGRARLREQPAFDLMVVIGGLSLWMLSAAGLVWLNPVSLLLFQRPFARMALFESGAFSGVTDEMLRVLVLFLAFGALSSGLGMGWDIRRWPILLGIFFGISLPLFTTFFTNGAGIATGYIGSLGYWLAQQCVQRGSQPLFYYFVIAPMYEFMPMLLALLALGYYLGRWVADATIPDRLSWAFRGFLGGWTVLSWAAYTLAGEKMPWLTVHLTVPMIMLSAVFLQDTLGALDWGRWWRGGGAIAALLAVPFSAALVGLVDAWPQARAVLQSATLPSLTAANQVIAAALAMALILGVWGYLGSHLGLSGLLQSFALFLLAALAFATLRVAWRFSFINYDMALEHGVYAHGGPGVKIAMRQIEEVAQAIGRDQTVVAYDNDSSWPFSWYLRDWRQRYFGETPRREDLESPILIVGSANWYKVENVLRNTHEAYQYHLIWWPMEDYRELTWERLKRWLLDPERRAALWDIFWNRDYTKYDQLTGKRHQVDVWPLAHDFKLFIRKDIAAKAWPLRPQQAVAPAESDPYAKVHRVITATLVIGGPGAEPGRFNEPHDVAFGPDGTIYVTDGRNHRIQVFAPDGRFLRAWGSFCALYEAGQPGCVDPDGPGQFNEPWGIAVAPDGSIYVADLWNHRIQQLAPDGRFLRAWGGFAPISEDPQDQPGLFYGPRELAVVGDRLYVTDTGNKRVQVFTLDGRFIAAWGGPGILPGQLDEPVGIAALPDGNLVIADTWNRRIQILTPQGRPVRSWPIAGWLDQSISTKPYVAVDARGRIFATDPTGFRVLVFDEQGNPLMSFGQYGEDAASFLLPQGIAIGPDGRVWVVDSGGNRVMAFPMP
ncbi:flippase activity-associated protein Agl23 [Thermoflexus sp.]|uniref:flippase activity-associated protein Agl23 n=1 Tax=Thermoflexus sp. TaxID=1969742 RepID=UPI0035E41D45